MWEGVPQAGEVQCKHNEVQGRCIEVHRWPGRVHEQRGAEEGCRSGRDLPEQLATFPAILPIDFVLGNWQGKSQMGHV